MFMKFLLYADFYLNNRLQCMHWTLQSLDRSFSLQNLFQISYMDINSFSIWLILVNIVEDQKEDLKKS